MCVRLGICLCMFMCIVRTWVCVSPELRLCICLKMFLLVFVLFCLHVFSLSSCCSTTLGVPSYINTCKELYFSLYIFCGDLSSAGTRFSV